VEIGLETLMDALMEGNIEIEKTTLSTINCGSRDCNSSAWAMSKL